jgi:hypothetical protein
MAGTPEASATVDAESTRQLLVRRLRSDGMGSLCSDEPRTYDDVGAHLSYVVMTALFLGITFALADWWELEFYGWLGVAAVLLLLAGVIALRWSPTTAALIILGGWLAASIAQWVAGPGADLLLTIVLPFGLTSAGVWVLRGRRLTTVVRSAPCSFQ